MKKIYKVEIRYGFMTERGIEYLSDWEFFTSKKAAFEFIDKREETQAYAGYYYPNAHVWEMYARESRFFMKSDPILNFSFTGLTLNF